MNWENDLSEKALDWMKFLGEYSPTIRVHNRTLKGYMYDGGEGESVLLSSSALREIANACIEAADWLDRRAEGSRINAIDSSVVSHP